MERDKHASGGGNAYTDALRSVDSGIPALEQLCTLAHDDDCALMAEGSHPGARCDCCLSYALADVRRALVARASVHERQQDVAPQALTSVRERLQKNIQCAVELSFCDEAGEITEDLWYKIVHVKLAPLTPTPADHAE